jgi:Fe2+ transport system protein FeoA
MTGSDESETARVVSGAGAVDPATGAASVRLRFDRPTRSAVGTPVQVEIDTEEHRDALVVPAAAIVREGNDTTVFVAADNKAQRRVVRLGLTDGARVEVVEGLKAGDLVITRGQNGLPDGAQITIEAAGGADAKDKTDGGGAR